MDTIHPPTGSRHPSPLSYVLRSQTQVSALSSASLRPFSNRLAAYTAYALMLIDLRLKVRSVDAMNRALQKRGRLRRARLLAQAELQSIYQHVALGLRLPRIPVHLPLRKRIAAAGLVSHRFIALLPSEFFTRERAVGRI